MSDLLVVALTFASMIGIGSVIVGGVMRFTGTRMNNALEWLGHSILVGFWGTGLALVLWMLAGGTLNLTTVWVLYALGVASIFLLVASRMPSHVLKEPLRFKLRPQFRTPIWWLVTIGAAGLLSWICIFAVHFPPHDYDSLVIWYFRDRVLFREGTLYADALRDPLRFAAQPLHPYLVPAWETLLLLAAGGQRQYYALRLGQALMLVGYGLLCYNLFVRLVAPRRRMLALSSLLLVPGMVTMLTFLSIREPLMACIAAGAMGTLIVWNRTGQHGYFILSAIYVILLQQTKVEGTPFMAGWFAGVAILVFRRSSLRLAIKGPALFATGLMLLCIPWQIAKRQIVPIHVDTFMRRPEAILEFGFDELTRALAVIGSEVLFRPEIYGLSIYAIAFCLFVFVFRGMKKGAWPESLPLVALVLALVLIYSSRQDKLAFERNSSIGRRLIVIIPATTLWAFASLPPKRRRHLSVSLGKTS